MANVPESEKPAKSLDGATARRTRSGALRPERHMLFDSKVRQALGMPRTGEVVERKYRVERLLGIGGMGAVFAASHVVTGKRVALKWLLPGASDGRGAELRLLREAKATARIEHPNVVNVFDVGRHASGLYLVMELLEGESLGQRLQRARIASGEAIALLMPALRGVAAAHAEGIVHRDLKPDNIFLCRDAEGRYRDSKVLDFGISKLTSGEELALTASGTLLGTPCYMSPEQIRGEGDVDERVDVYAVGVILYELLADAFPFTATHYNGLLLQIVMSEPVPLSEREPELSPLLCQVVAKAMAKDLSVRFASVRDLARQLEPFANGVPFIPRISAPEPVLGRAVATPAAATRVESERLPELEAAMRAEPKRMPALATIVERGRDSGLRPLSRRGEAREPSDDERADPTRRLTEPEAERVGREPRPAESAVPRSTLWPHLWRGGLWLTGLALLGLLAVELGPRRPVRRGADSKPSAGEPVGSAATAPQTQADPHVHRERDHTLPAPGRSHREVPLREVPVVGRQVESAEKVETLPEPAALPPEPTTPPSTPGPTGAGERVELGRLPDRLEPEALGPERLLESEGPRQGEPPMLKSTGAQPEPTTPADDGPPGGSKGQSAPPAVAAPPPAGAPPDVAPPAGPGPAWLPENWDDRVRLPTPQGGHADSPAGPISPEDL